MMKRIATIIVLGVLIVSCKKEKTIWETDWSAPLINDTLSLVNLVNDSTLDEVGGFYVLDLNRTLFNHDLADIVGIPDTTIQKVFTFSGTLNLSPGFSFVNSAEEHELSIPGIELKTIRLKEGFIDVKVQNPLGTKTIFNLTLPGVTKNSVTFTNQYEAPAGSSTNPGVTIETIDLSGYRLDLTGLTGGDFNILRSQITVATDSNGPSVFITPADETKVDATFRDVKIDYARGYFGNEIISDTTEVFIEIMNNIQSGTIDLPNTSIIFEIENGIKVDAEGTVLTVSNVNKAGNVVDLTSAQIGSSFNLDAATGSWGTLASSFESVEFNSSNSNIEGYLENLGAKHTFGYSMQLNPWGNTSGSYDEIFPDSKLRINMKATMPLSIGIDDLVLRDTFDLQINQDPEKTKIKSGELILQASNGFPISGTVKLILRNQNGNVMHTVEGSSPLSSSLSGVMNADHGFFVSSSELKFILTEEVLSDINDVRNIVIESSFNTINELTGLSEIISIPVGAFLAVKLKTKLKSENIY
jgi:hypothetical protein